jgi:hypothetical protein
LTSNHDDERRVHPRYPRSLELSGSPARGGSPALLVASNVSLGGVYCTSDQDFPEMTRLAVRMTLPPRPGRRSEPEPLDLSAIVVRRLELAPGRERAERARFELALLFHELTPPQRERLAELLETAENTHARP